MHRLQAALGLIVMLSLLVLFSSHRRAIRWRVVLWGIGLQVLFALIVLKVPAGYAVFRGVNIGFLKIMDATETGARFLFGPLAGGGFPVGEVDASEAFRQTGSRIAWTGTIFAFRILPTIILFSALMAVGYYLGIMQRVVQAVARVMSFTMRTSGPETLSAAANIFVGQSEAPLVIRPYVAGMTQSELMAVMTAGFATVAGGVMASFVGLLHESIPDIGAHLMTASVMSAPAALVMAKMLVPETENPRSLEPIRLDATTDDVNVVDAIARGSTDGLKLALNVAAMLLVFIALVALVDEILAALSLHVFNRQEPWSLALIFGWLFRPVAWLLGVQWEDCGTVGQLLGTKTFLNEFVAYVDLARITQETGDAGLAPRSRVIASYALCGFANIGSIGIQIGGIGAIAPERRSDLARLGFKAMIAGSLAAFSTACIVAILT
jgi:CNT family concentrative nucleoside transporter